VSYIPFNTIKNLIQTSGVATQSNMVNGSGQVLGALTPVSVNYTGTIQKVDVSLGNSALTVVGITVETIADTASGIVVTQGRIVDVALPFNVGDFVYVSKTGGLMNTLPEVDQAGFQPGDYVIRLGVIAKNETNPAKKDMFLGLLIVGQL
jgi:hypothetical protein